MISLNWVKDYIDIANEDPKELAVKVTKAGINVEKVVSSQIDNLVIGEIKEVEKHPDSDHLNLCKVDVKEEVLQIVCGASNVREGLKVIVAKEGAVLPGNFEIKKGKIRGVESCGMLCALFELGLEEKTEETYAKGIAELDDNAPVGEDALKYLGLDDVMYELDVHKHRNNDCYYHIGFAYEIGTILGKKVTLPKDDFKDITKEKDDYVNIKVETNKCPYYSARIVRNVTIKESPDFIKNRLTNAGMRPINNVVDISNYVMLEYGQPLHFFDFEKLGHDILVRDAKDNEKIMTLDGKERTLDKDDIVITDGEKPVCIAGVMGGENTDVDQNTKNIVIEAAIFDAISIRNTANKLDLKSEASTRYGKGLNYEYTKNALNRACHLLEKYADANVVEEEYLYDNLVKEEKKVSFKTNEINNILGMTLKDSDVEEELNKLDFKYKKENDTFNVVIPNRRLDIDPNINDIAEEIGRLYGYDNLASTLPIVGTKRGVYKDDILLRKEISKRLRSLGLNECKTYTLVSPKMAEMFKYEDKKQILLPNPMSIDKSVIRTSIIPSLLDVYDYNISRNVSNVFIYEISKTYDKDYNEESKVAVLIKGSYLQNNWKGENIKADFYVLKGILENTLDYLGFKNKYSLKPENINDLQPGVSAKIMLGLDELGIIGKVHPNITKDEVYVMELSMTKLYNSTTKKLKYKPVSKYPDITKDVAFILDKDVISEEVEKEIKKYGNRILTNIEAFDLYEGDKIPENKKQIAYNLTFNDSTRTLQDEEVDKVFKSIIENVNKKFNCEIRDK